MARRKIPKRSGAWLFQGLPTTSDLEGQSSLLDVIDEVLNRGVVVNGDLILGVANVDLIFAKLSVLLAAVDRVMDRRNTKIREGSRRKHEGPPRTPRSRRSTKKK